MLTYDDVLSTHKVLFEAVYPWAGEDRIRNALDIAVSKGTVLFARPDDIRRAIDYALEKGRDKALMLTKPGEIMGHLAYGHPFLDGNGRTIMVVHSVLAQRAGFSIDWAATDKTAYLNALTEEIRNLRDARQRVRSSTRQWRSRCARMRACFGAKLASMTALNPHGIATPANSCASLTDWTVTIRLERR